MLRRADSVGKPEDHQKMSIPLRPLSGSQAAWRKPPGLLGLWSPLQNGEPFPVLPLHDPRVPQTAGESLEYSLQSQH